jgi:hypothetical protein
MIVRKEYRFFDVFPRIVPADGETTIEIRPTQDMCINASYELAYLPMNSYGPNSDWGEVPYTTVTPDDDGIIRFRQVFHREQEHTIVIKWKRYGDGSEQISDLHLYSLEADLFSRRPYKGDIHIHSARSDGREDPAFVMASCRKIGLDFAAVTDHGKYSPSLEAIDAYADVPIDMKIFPGEEVHLPETRVHIINFGGDRSVNMAGEEDHEQHRHEIAALIEQLGPLPEGVDPAGYAECVWAFDRIRQAGGLAMFCHPYWEVFHRYHPGHPLSDHLFETQLFDAYEVLGGYDADSHSNTLQVARYYEESAKGRKIPIAGVTDAHGCEGRDLFGWYYTIVFAPSTDLPDLIGSIKDLYSVGMESLPNDRPRPVGPIRLVQYALFLEREVFPQHDELCFEEGRLMMAHLAGHDEAAGRLAALKGQTQAFYNRLWAS